MKLRITVQGQAYEVDVEVLDGSLPTNIAPPQAKPVPPAATVSAAVSTPPQSVIKPNFTVPTDASVNAERSIKAPIVGTVMQVKVSVGEQVAVNQVLLVMEAMKMETNVASPLAGKVKRVLVTNGEAVKAGQVLVELE